MSEHFVDITKGIKVTGLDYNVECGKEAHDECRAEDRYGVCSFMEQTIKVDTTFSPQRTSETFIHEAIEAVNNRMLCKLKHDQIQQLAIGLHQVMESLGVRFGVPDA